MATFLRELKRRRVPQFLGLYAGVGWAVLQFVDWLVKRYLFSNHWVDVTLVGLVAFLPSALLIAWRHGAPGQDAWGKAEKVGLPLNAAIALVLILVLFQGEDLSATTEIVTVKDETGQTIERQVPKASHRKRLAIFFWDNASGDENIDWLRSGFPLMLAKDLEQDPFLQVMTPFSDYEKYFYSRLQRAGYPDGRGVPLPLQGRVAASYRLPFFLDGEFERDGESYRVRFTLYSSEPVEALAEHRFEGTDPFRLVDEIAVQLKNDLEVPSGSVRLASDLPVAEHLSVSLEAIEDYVAAENLFLLDNDRPGALEHLGRAVEKDPSFAVAQLKRSEILGNEGRTGEARGALSAARQHDYKLSERKRLLLKSWEYILRGEFDKRTALFEMWVELYPEDVFAHLQLANSYVWTGSRIDEAIATFERAYELEPAQDWVLGRLTDLLMLEERFEEAVTTAEKLAELQPDEAASYTGLGEIHERLGDFATARQNYDKASLLGSGLVNPTLYLARLDLKEGRLDSALERLDEAAETASSPQQKALVLRFSIDLRFLLGQLEQAADLVDRLVEVESAYRAPIEVMIGVEVFMSDVLIAAGREEEVSERLAEIAAAIEPPFDALVDSGYVPLHIERGELAKAKLAQERLADSVEKLDRDDLEALLQWGKAAVLDLEGDAEAAAATYGEALRLFRRSPLNTALLTRHQAEADILVGQARALRGAGQDADARASLDEALRIYPSHPGAHFETARHLIERGEPLRARPHLERAVELWRAADPGFEPARQARELLAELDADVP